MFAEHQGEDAFSRGYRERSPHGKGGPEFPFSHGSPPPREGGGGFIERDRFDLKEDGKKYPYDIRRPVSQYRREERPTSRDSLRENAYGERHRDDNGGHHLPSGYDNSFTQSKV